MSTNAKRFGYIIDTTDIFLNEPYCYAQYYVVPEPSKESFPPILRKDLMSALDSRYIFEITGKKEMSGYLEREFRSYDLSNERDAIGFSTNMAYVCVYDQGDPDHTDQPFVKTDESKIRAISLIHAWNFPDEDWNIDEFVSLSDAINSVARNSLFLRSGIRRDDIQVPGRPYNDGWGYSNICDNPTLISLSDRHLLTGFLSQITSNHAG